MVCFPVLVLGILCENIFCYIFSFGWYLVVLAGILVAIVVLAAWLTAAKLSKLRQDLALIEMEKSRNLLTNQ